MEKYIRLEEEKARTHGKVFNWETAMYGKIWDNEDVHNLGSIETEFPAIVFNDNVSSETLSFESTIFVRDKMTRDVITVGSTMRITLLYRGEYSQWCERFMNYLEEQTDGEAMINSIQNGDHPFPVVAQVKAVILYEHETFKATEGEQMLDTYLRYLQVINDLKKCSYKKDNCELNYKFLNNLQPERKQYGDVNDALGYKKKVVVVTSDPLALVAEKTKVSKRKEKVEVQSESEGSDDEDISDLKKITALLAKAFNRKKYYAKPTNNNLRTSSASSSANKKLEYVKSVEKKEDKKADEKKMDMNKLKCYNCKKEGHVAKDCKKAKVKDYNYYKTKMLLAKKDSDEQVLLAEDQAWIESSSDSDQEINANMVFMAKMEKVLLDSNESSSSAEETIAEEKNNESNEQLKVLNEKNADLLAQMKVLQDQLKVKHVVIDTHTECFENPSYFDKAKDLRPSLYDERVIGLGLYASYDENDLFIFDDESVRNFQVSKMSFKKKPRDSMNVRYKSNSNKSLPRTVHWWLPKMQQLAELVAKWIPKVKHCPDLSLDHRFVMFKAYDSIEQFYDKGLEVAFRKSTCFVRNEDGVDLLTDDRSSNLYSIALNEVASNSSACLPKMKFKKDHLCSAREQGKIHRKHHKSKTVFASNKSLYLLHMNLCGLMRVESINEKRYVLVVVDDYSRLEPGLSNLNEMGKSSNPSVSQVSETSKKDLKDLFQNLYDEYFDSSKIMKSSTTNVETSNVEIPSHKEEVFHESFESFQEESSSSSLNENIKQSLEKVRVPS
nr:hypothetical protein [Tanacetum cinerariifolium]